MFLAIRATYTKSQILMRLPCLEIEISISKIFMKKPSLFLFFICFASFTYAQCNTCLGRKVITRTDTCTSCQGEGSFVTTVEKDCPNCSGHGHTTHPCPTCNTRKVVTEQETCPSCNGKRVKDGYKTCPVCNGFGMYTNRAIPGDNSLETCYMCHGNKQVPAKVDCGACSGSGTISREKRCPSCYGGGTITKDCHACSNGKIRETITQYCKTCKGRRQIARQIPCPTCSKFQ